MTEMDKCPTQQVSYELTRGNETIGIWHIKGWNCEDKDDFELLKSSAVGLVDVDLSSGPGGVLLGPTPVTRLRFHFEDYLAPQFTERTTKYGNASVRIQYLNLVVEQVSNKGGQVVKYDLKVESVDEKLNPIRGEHSARIEKRTNPFKFGTEKEVLKQEFIKLQKNNLSYPADPPDMFHRPEELRLKISVTPIFVRNDRTKNDDGNTAKNGDEESSLCLGLKDLLAADENYADLKLETKDGMTLSAHKVILAARSPVLRELLEKEVKNNDFTGTIKLADVNAKPMMVIIHWMYSGELQENAGKCMEEVVNAAITFQLTGLIKILDKKVITICNPENMFDLFRVVKANGMARATEDIANFITENLRN